MLTLLEHQDGIAIDASVRGLFKSKAEHDPSDLEGGRRWATQESPVPVGLFYRDPEAARYDEMTAVGIDMTSAARLEAIQTEIDRFRV